jgi:protein TonB
MLSRNSAAPGLAERHIAGGRLPPSAQLTADEELGAAQCHAVVGAIVALHAAALWALLQVQAVRDAAVQAAPILVSLLATPIAPAPSLPPAPAPKPQPLPKAQPVPQPALLATPRPATSAAISLPPPQEAEAPVTAPAPVTSSAATAEPVVAAAPATAPAPKLLPDDAVQYLVAPQLAYPPLSLRRHETGLVIVRAYVGTEGGVPRTVQVERSSSHARLDQAALAAVQQARFKPYAEKGQPVEGWALIPIRFELEK